MTQPPVVHSALPETLTSAASDVFDTAAVAHVAHGDGDAVAAAEAVVDDRRAVALLGPLHSAHVAEALEVTAPAGLPLLAPVATWAGVTRLDEPGCDEAARHRGTVLRWSRATPRSPLVSPGTSARQGLRVLVVIGQDSRSERARRGLASPGQSTPGGHRR